MLPDVGQDLSSLGSRCVSVITTTYRNQWGGKMIAHFCMP